MKKLLFIALLGLAMTSCKKSDTSTPVNNIQLVVTGLSAKTDISITVTNQTNITLLSISSKFGDNTFTISPITSGDKLTIHYSSNYPNTIQGDGAGDIKFLYAGKNIAELGGDLGYKTGYTSTVNVP